MTARQMLEFLKTLDEDELECEVEIRADWRSLKLKRFGVVVDTMGADMNGVYVMDSKATEDFEAHMGWGDKIGGVE